MARVTLNQPVNANGDITTIAALLDSGRAFVERVEHWGKNDVVAYFATMIDSSGNEAGSWQIGQKAYESRAAKGQNTRPNIPTPAKIVNGARFEPLNHTLMIDSVVFPCEFQPDIDSFNVLLPDEAALKALRAIAEVFYYEAANPIGINAGVWVDFFPFLDE